MPDLRRIVLLHGMLGSPAGFDALIAEMTAAGVRAEYLPRVLPGHGAERWGMELTSFDAVADAIAEDVPRGATVIGYSLGGRLALSIATRHPGRVARVVAIGADLGIEVERERRIRRTWDRSHAELVRARGMEALVDAWEALPVFATQKDLPRSVLDAQRRARMKHEPEGIAWALSTLGTGSMRPLYDGLERCRVPIHLVAGALDEKFSAIARRAAQRLPSSRAQLIEGAGHNPLLEKPRALAATLATLLGDEECHRSDNPRT
ncbi:MAG: alpha/beta fold hydrolase [Polyangiaceae bacterium]|nr:alpha/beta fold hydrolase [Polyangiaceae bacterium]